MEYPMHPELKVGNKFPDFELPDHTGTSKKLSQLLSGYPGVVSFIRGNF
jgi:peroxiredoxin